MFRDRYDSLAGVSGVCSAAGRRPEPRDGRFHCSLDLGTQSAERICILLKHDQESYSLVTNGKVQRPFLVAKWSSGAKWRATRELSVTVGILDPEAAGRTGERHQTRAQNPAPGPGRRGLDSCAQPQHALSVSSWLGAVGAVTQQQGGHDGPHCRCVARSFQCEFSAV